MDDAGLPLDFYLTEDDRALLMAPTIVELARGWQGAAREGLSRLSSGSGPGAAARLSRALAAGGDLRRAETAREVARAAARICAAVAEGCADEGQDGEPWATLADDLACWAWVAA